MWVGQRIICVITIKLERYILQLKLSKNQLSIHCICLCFLGGWVGGLQSDPFWGLLLFYIYIYKAPKMFFMNMS